MKEIKFSEIFEVIDIEEKLDFSGAAGVEDAEVTSQGSNCTVNNNSVPGCNCS